jgi:hypothetical protein
MLFMYAVCGDTDWGFVREGWRKRQPDPLWQVERFLDFRNRQRRRLPDLPHSCHGVEYQSELE